MSTHPSPEQLGAYLDGELDAPARAAVDTHLRECAECGAHLVELSAVDDAARSLPLSAPDGYFEDFAPRVRARLAKRTTARWRPPVWGWAVAAALLLAVITPLALQDHRPSAPAATPQVVAEPAKRAEAPAEADTMTGGGTLQRASPAAEAPPATVPVPQAPAPRAALRKDQVRAAEDADGRLADRDESRANAQPPPAAAPARPDAKLAETAPEQEKADAKKELSEEQLDHLRALGYVASPPPPPPAPATSQQRQHGPRAQGAAAVGGTTEGRKAATAEPKDKAGFAVEPEEKAASGADAPGSELQESVEVTTRSRDLGQGAAWAKFRSLADSSPPRSDADARLLRESWRKFADENPDHPQADEARVRTVEAGALAYRLGRRPQDREIALRDGRAYLERPAAPQAARVRAALKTLEPAAP
jgi:hypothetical protein